MFLGVIPIFWFEFLSDLEKIAKRSKEGKLGKSGLRHSEGCLTSA